MKNKFWTAILAIILVISAVASIPLLLPSDDAAWAEIRSNGDLIRTVNLKMDQEFSVPCSDGFNTVTIQDGKIAVIEATCPDRYCMERGFCSGGAAIVCLPNGLVIQFIGDQEIDGKIG